MYVFIYACMYVCIYVYTHISDPSPLPGFNSSQGMWKSCEWLGLGGGFRRVLWFKRTLIIHKSLLNIDNSFFEYS